MDDDVMLKIFGEHEQQTITQMWNCLDMEEAMGGVLCADGHLGYAQPVGGVIAYEDHISISGVGFDIACGNAAVRLDVQYDKIKDTLDAILDDINETISFGVGLKNNETVEHNLFNETDWRGLYDDMWKTKRVKIKSPAQLRDLAQSQLGTVGGGNHYVDIFTDELGWVWIGVHFGSRGLGHKTATHFLNLAGGKDGIHVKPTLVHQDSEIGKRYLAAMEVAGKYAYAGRNWVIEKVRQIIGGNAAYKVHNHHNFAWRERHFGTDCWVVRKGATPAFPGEEGFVGGSMGDDAVIVRGVQSTQSANALYSTVHGAGRLFGRRVAKETFTHEEMDQWIQRKGVKLRGGDLDESPMAYRRLHEVLDHHKDTIDILHTLRPVGVVMAGKRGYDPYKD